MKLVNQSRFQSRFQSRDRKVASSWAFVFVLRQRCVTIKLVFRSARAEHISPGLQPWVDESRRH